MKKLITAVAFLAVFCLALPALADGKGGKEFQDKKDKSVVTFPLEDGKGTRIHEAGKIVLRPGRIVIRGPWGIIRVRPPRIIRMPEKIAAPSCPGCKK